MHSFRDPAHKQRALEARNRGEGKAHASWDKLAKARAAHERETQAERCPFDLYLAGARDLVADSTEAFRLVLLDIREREQSGFRLADIPF